MATATPTDIETAAAGAQGPEASTEGSSPAARRTARARAPVAAILVAAGLTASVEQYVRDGRVEYTWPLLAAYVGAALAAWGLLQRSNAGTAGPESQEAAEAGCVIAAVGLIGVIQIATDRPENLLYAWALLPIAAAAGRWLHCRRTGAERRGVRPRTLALGGLASLLTAVLVFEGVANIGGGSPEAVRRNAVPALLVVVGIALVARVPHRHRAKPTDTSRHPQPKEDGL
jgi:hypothetical protein